MQAFAAAYASATEAGDVEFLFERLHPVVIASSDEATCRAFVEREIVQITGYRLTGPIEQTVQTFDIAGSQVTVDPLFRVEATFTFQGQEVTDTALFAPVDGELRWFSVCR